MKVLSTEALTKLIQLVKSAFIKVDNVVEVTEIETETPSEITLADVAISGSYDDLSDKPTIPSEVTESTVSGWGFTKNTGTVTSVNNVSPVNGNVTLSIPIVPTNVSAFTNDSGYITSSALTPYALSADLASVATSGSYNDLSDKPTIPAAQVNSDWNATSGVAQILNKPTIPIVPTNVSAFTNDSGYITSSALNGYATQAWVGQQGYITGITSSDVTTALGYTPYDASNPSGYITSSALVPYALSADLASVATSGSYNDLSNKPTIPTVNNATLTIQKNGSNVATFTANASSNVTANISVPNTVSSVSSTSTNADAVGAKLFYDTVGDIETLINAL